MRTSENTAKKQMIFRFDEDFSQKLKRFAKKESMSVNAYVEFILSKEFQKKERFPKLERPKTFDPEIENLCGVLKGFNLTDEDIAKDKYEYLISK